MLTYDSKVNVMNEASKVQTICYSPRKKINKILMNQKKLIKEKRKSVCCVFVPAGVQWLVTTFLQHQCINSQALFSFPLLCTHIHCYLIIYSLFYISFRQLYHSWMPTLLIWPRCIRSSIFLLYVKFLSCSVITYSVL